MSAEPPSPAGRIVTIPTMAGLWAVIAVALPVAGAFASRIMAIDLAYQIRAGGIMLDTHRLLDVDTFTFTISGQPWLNQQWGSEVLLAVIHRAGGWTGIALARGLLLGLTMFFVYRACRSAGASSRTAALLSLGGWLVGVEILPAHRPQGFGFVLFAATLWAVTTRHTSARRVWLVPLFVVPWANLHGSFPLALVLLLLAWLEDRRSDPASAPGLLAVGGGASLLATLVNPFGLRVWSYVAELSTNPVVSQRISEWGPPSIHTPTGLFFFASLFAVALVLARGPRATGWLPLLTLALFAGLGLLAIRGVVWWALVAPVVVSGLIRDEDRPRDSSRSSINAVVAISLVVVVVLTLPIGRGTDRVTGGPAVLTYTPEDLVATAREAGAPGTRAFVSQLYASWSELSAPEMLVAVDPRIEIFPESVWDDYYLVSGGQEGWEEVLDAWGVTVLVLEPTQAEGLLEVIDRHPEWRRIASGAPGSVYVRSQR